MVRNTKTGQVTFAEPTKEGYAKIAQAMVNAQRMGATVEDAGGTNTLKRMSDMGYDSEGKKHGFGFFGL